MRILARPAFSNRAGNPYQWLLYTHVEKLGAEVHEHSRWRLLTGRYDVWHLHWPESPLNKRSPLRALTRILGLFGLMSVARLRGTKVVWTAHNLSAHEEQHPRLARWFWRRFVRRLDGCIHLSQAGRAEAERVLPGLSRVPGHVIPHGHYRGAYPDQLTRESARAQLGLGSRDMVLAFVGQVRRYKGVVELCRAFRALHGSGLRLIVAGEAKDPALRQELEALACTDERIVLRLSFVADGDLERYVKAADLIVLPFSHVLNSGSAMLALTFDRPVLVPSTGPFEELRAAVGDAWVRTYEGHVDEHELAEALAWSAGDRPEQSPLDAFDWTVLARRTVLAFRSIAGLAAAEEGAATEGSMPGSRPLVSVVIPVYNRPRQVLRALESVFAQTYTNLEIVVVDDGSTDETSLVLSELQDPRIRTIRHEQNRGGSAARNTGVSASTGGLVAFLDSDDEWHREKIESQVAVFAGTPSTVGLVYTGAEWVFPGAPSVKRIPRHRGDLSRHLLTSNVVGGTSTGMVRRSAFEGVGGFDESLPAMQDMELWLRLAERCEIDFAARCLTRIHKADQHRITLDYSGRIRARALFLDKHGDKMRRAGVLHRYLLKSGRLWQRPGGDLAMARACYLRAIHTTPLSVLPYLYLASTFVPTHLVWRFKGARRRLRACMKLAADARP